MATAAAILVPRVLAGSRATAPDDLFSVALPSGWKQTSGPHLTPPNSITHGRMWLVGPGNRTVLILWDPGIAQFGFNDESDTQVRSLPVIIAGHATVVADYQLYENGVAQHRQGFVTGPSRMIQGRSIGFDAECDPGPTGDTTYSWCLSILSSWQWGSGAS